MILEARTMATTQAPAPISYRTRVAGYIDRVMPAAIAFMINDYVLPPSESSCTYSCGVFDIDLMVFMGRPGRQIIHADACPVAPGACMFCGKVSMHSCRCPYRWQERSCTSPDVCNAHEQHLCNALFDRPVRTVHTASMSYMRKLFNERHGLKPRTRLAFAYYFIGMISLGSIISTAATRPRHPMWKAQIGAAVAGAISFMIAAVC